MVLAVVANGAPVPLTIERRLIEEEGATVGYDLVDWDAPRTGATHISLEFLPIPDLREEGVGLDDLLAWGDQLPRATDEEMIDVNF